MIAAGELGPEDMQLLPWISATGAISNSDNTLGTFDLDPDQYISAFKDLKGVPHSFPIRAHVDLMSKRYKNIKPSFKNGRFVSVTGYLTWLQTEPARDELEQRFVIAVANFDFLGYAPPPPAASPTPLSKSTVYLRKTGCESKGITTRTHRHTK